MANKFEGYTGKIAESEVLGETTPEEKEREKEFNGEYISFKQAVELVKDNGRQPFEDQSRGKAISARLARYACRDAVFG